MAIVNQASFIPTAEVEFKSFGSIQNGTVEVTLGRETRRVKAWKTVTDYDGAVKITASDMTGRYKSGAKAWPAVVSHYVEGNLAGQERVSFGRDDRNPKFNKANCLFFK